MPAAREIAARESRATALSRPAQTSDFEGPFGKRLRAGAHIDASVTLQAPAAGRLPLTAMSEEQGKKELLSR